MRSVPPRGSGWIMPHFTRYLHHDPPRVVVLTSLQQMAHFAARVRVNSLAVAQLVTERTRFFSPANIAGIFNASALKPAG